MNLNLPINFQDKIVRERFLAVIVLILLVVFSIIEYKLVKFIRPIPKYSNVLIFAVININLILILILSFLVIRNLVKLLFEEKIHLLGAKLKRKLTVAFVIISLLPTMLLFFISLQFLQTSLAYWFDIKIEKSLEQAISIGRNFYKYQIDQLKRMEDQLSSLINLKCVKDESKNIDIQCVESILNPSSYETSIFSCLRRPQINIARILDDKGHIVWTKNWLPLTDEISAPSIDTLKSFDKDNSFHVSSIETSSGTLLLALRPLISGTTENTFFLCIGKLLPQPIMTELESVKRGYEEYKQLKLYQNPLKTSLISTLFLITLLIIFVSIWFALKLAKSITEPVQMLSDATHRIAQGDLNFRLDIKGRDELSSLVQAFNTMTKDLKEARRRAQEASRRLLKSYSELEHRNAYIEMLLENITAGVISLDKHGKITTINKSACSILEKKASSLLGADYRDLLKDEELKDFEGIKEELLSSKDDSIKRSIRISLGNKVKSLIINFSLLKDKDGKFSGVLIVFDDLTELERIQRLAAWRDVARRIAHEIKNPLTPIKLSAQRLKRKFSNKFNQDEYEVFERCTNTIIDQADELKKLVDEFSRFARMPAPELKKINILEVINEVIEIYKPLIKTHFEYPKNVPFLMIDKEQIKRVFINIFDNAISAGLAKNIFVNINYNQNKVVISIADDGIGISVSDMEKIFDPYFSRKKGGTGLGLAIVKSIMDAHNAQILVEKNNPKGTKFYLIFKGE